MKSYLVQKAITPWNTGKTKYESVEVKAAEGEASGRSYEREDDSLEPYAYEPLADEEMARKLP